MSLMGTGAHISAPTLASPPSKLRAYLWVAVGVGVVVLIGAIVGGWSQRAWQIYLVNFLFWSGIAQGGVVMAAVYRLTNARWGDRFARIGEGMAAFLPISFLLYLVLVTAGASLFPWLHHPVPGKETWLSGPFLFGRDALAFLLLIVLSGIFVYRSIRPDVGYYHEHGTSPPPILKKCVSNWKGWENEVRSSHDCLRRLVPGTIVAFVLLYTLVGFDLVMALDPHWHSTLFGWMYALHAFFASIVTVALLAVFSRGWTGPEQSIAGHQWHDMGRFLFGISLLSGGFFWAQYLTIWYGNLPDEIPYLLKRFYSLPWEPLMWVYIILAYLFPLAVFLSRKVKEMPSALFGISFLIFIALFIERFIAVVPSVWSGSSIPFGILEFLVTVGFGGAFALSWIAFASAVPIVPSSFRPRDLP